MFKSNRPKMVFTQTCFGNLDRVDKTFKYLKPPTNEKSRHSTVSDFYWLTSNSPSQMLNPQQLTSAEHLVQVTVLEKDPGALLPGFNNHCLGLGSYPLATYVVGGVPANIWINQRKMGRMGGLGVSSSK